MLFFLFIYLAYSQNIFYVVGLGNNFLPIKDFGICQFQNNCSTSVCDILSGNLGCFSAAALVTNERQDCLPININYKVNIMTVFFNNGELTNSSTCNKDMNECLVNYCNSIKNSYTYNPFIMVGVCH